MMDSARTAGPAGGWKTDNKSLTGFGEPDAIAPCNRANGMHKSRHKPGSCPASEPSERESCKQSEGTQPSPVVQELRGVYRTRAPELSKPGQLVQVWRSVLQEHRLEPNRKENPNERPQQCADSDAFHLRHLRNLRITRRSPFRSRTESPEPAVVRSPRHDKQAGSTRVSSRQSAAPRP